MNKYNKFDNYLKEYPTEDGYTFYGVKEKNKKELLNINHYDDYLELLD